MADPLPAIIEVGPVCAAHHLPIARIPGRSQMENRAHALEAASVPGEIAEPLNTGLRSKTSFGMAKRSTGATTW